jgi:hypothetical protein
MRGTTYWIGQFLLAAGSLFALLVIADLVNGTAFAHAWPGALAWAVVAAAVFIGSRYHRARKSQPRAKHK